MFWQGKEKQEEEDSAEEGQRQSGRGLTVDTESSELIEAQTRAVPWLFDCWVNTDIYTPVNALKKMN